MGAFDLGSIIAGPSVANPAFAGGLEFGWRLAWSSAKVCSGSLRAIVGATDIFAAVSVEESHGPFDGLVVFGASIAVFTSRPRRPGVQPAAIVGPLAGNPALGRRCLPEDVVGIPPLDTSLADAQNCGSFPRPAGPMDGDIFMEAGMVAEAAEEQLQRLRLDDRLARRIVDHQMREIGLAGDRAKRSEFGRGEAHKIERAGARIGHVIEPRFVRRGGQCADFAEVRCLHRRALAAVAFQAYPGPVEEGNLRVSKPIACLWLALGVAAPCTAQAGPPLIAPDAASAIAAEISGSAAKRTVQSLSAHHRMRGSEGYNAAAS